MADIILKIKNTEGVAETVKLTVVNKISRRLKAGKSYRFGDLVVLAESGELSEDATTESPALVGMSQDEALEPDAEPKPKKTTSTPKE
jgi:hypothetical protein